MLRIAIILITFISLLIISCEGEIFSPGYRDISIRISNHFLPDYFITSISFDSEGTAWLGTFKQGIIKYNGDMVLYDANNSSLPDSIVIWDIAVDKHDNVWIGTDKGLIKFDKNIFTIYNTSNSPLAEDVVWAISIDESNNLWLASCRFQQGGLMKFDGDYWTLYTPENSELPSNSIRDVLVDKENNIWLAMSEIINNGCIIKISGEAWAIYDTEDLGIMPYYFGNLAVDANNNLYASIDYTLSSLWDMTRPNIIKFDGSTWSTNNPVDENNNTLGYVGIISTDLSGNLWAVMHGREGIHLAVYNGKNWIYNDFNIPLSWSSDIAVDKHNNVWLSTVQGIYIIEQ
jgi:ligand-binding sensor domain-containing protein